ncbi:hypothetical protein [Leptospira semungkisensis]|uniref:hypothetical protein n=1 Tax=Leptospira semungkisensis TaxID=2484985 RepID=UPI001FE6985A|nr:hypothetical protein [Leptospira semungkisensis]
MSTLIYINRDRLSQLWYSYPVFNTREEAIASAESSGKKGIIFFITPLVCGDCGLQTRDLEDLDHLGWTLLKVSEGSLEYERILSDDRFQEALALVRSGRPSWGIMNLGEELLLLEPGSPKKDFIQKLSGSATQSAEP